MSVRVLPHSLGSALKAAFNHLPELPPKGGGNSEKFLEKRKAGLAAYLNGIVEDQLLRETEDGASPKLQSKSQLKSRSTPNLTLNLTPQPEPAASYVRLSALVASHLLPSGLS